MQLTERDKIVIEKIIKRGWVSSKYLARFFPSHFAMIHRLRTLRENKIIESKNIKELVKESEFNQKTLNLTKYLSNRLMFYKLNEEFFKKFKESYKKFSDKRMIVHQIYQEYVEIFFLTEFNVLNIESNPEFNPIPDLYFKYNNKNISVEIERSVKRNKANWSYKNVEGLPTKKVPRINYEKHISMLLERSDLVFYFFENDKELSKFLKNTYSKRLYCSTLNKLETVVDYNGETVPIEQVLNG